MCVYIQEVFDKRRCLGFGFLKKKKKPLNSPDFKQLPKCFDIISTSILLCPLWGFSQGGVYLSGFVT